LAGQNQVSAASMGGEAGNDPFAGSGEAAGARECEAAAEQPDGPTQSAMPGTAGGSGGGGSPSGVDLLAVADFEQSGKIRSETRQLLQKYLLGLLGYMGSFAFFITKDITDKPIYIGAACMSFAVFLILLKCVNLYAEQIQIATHHIRNQASHRLRLGQGIVGLQGINLFSRQRSISGVASFFIPHWTTRTEFSMVYAMLGAAFLPVLQSWYFFREINNGTFFFIVELAVALMFLSQNLLDIFSYLVASRVTTPDNPVPTMRKTHLVEMPRKQNVTDSFERNRKLLAATTLVFGSLLVLFFGDWKVAGGGLAELLLKLLTNLAPYILVIWYIRVVNKHLFDDHIYRKSGVGLHAAYLTLMSFVGIGYFLILAPLFDKLPGLSPLGHGIWAFCAILLGGVTLLQGYFNDQQQCLNGNCAWLCRKSSFYSLLYVFICSSVYFALKKEDIGANAEEVFDGALASMKEAVAYAQNHGLLAASITLAAVAVISCWIWTAAKSRRRRASALPGGASWSLVVPVWMVLVLLVYALEQWDNIAINKFFSRGQSPKFYYLVFVLPAALSWAILLLMIKRYLLREGAGNVPNIVKGCFGLAVGVSVGIIIYNYTTELFYLIDIGLLALAFLMMGRWAGRSTAKLNWYSYFALLMVCCIVVGAFNRLQFGSGVNAGADLLAFFKQWEGVNSYLWAPPSGRAFAWTAVFLAINIVVFGAGLMSVLVKFLVSAARLFEFKSLEAVVNQAHRPHLTWSGVEWRVERPKKNVFRYLQTLLVVLIAGLGLSSETPEYLLVALSLLLLYLTISDLFFEREMLFCGQWLTEYSGMHLLADRDVGDGLRFETISEYLDVHGIEPSKLEAFIERFAKRRHRDAGGRRFKDARVAIRRLIDNSFYATLKQRMNVIFYIDHSTTRARELDKSQASYNGFKNGVNKDRHILARSMRLVNRSSLMTPVRYIFLKPWARELISIYDNLGQPHRVWSNRASFLTKTPIHSSVINSERGRKYRVMLSSLTQAGQRMLAGVAKSIHLSVVEAEDIIHKTKHTMKLTPDAKLDLKQLEDAIRALKERHTLHASIPPHKVLLSCLGDIDAKKDEAEVRNRISSYEEIDVIFMGNCGGKHYDILGIPYIYNKSKSFCFRDIFSIKSHLSFLVTHYHPATLLRIKPDMVIMCGSSYFNINLAKFCRKINPRIRLAYLSPPHAEISSHVNDNRALDILKHSDLVVTTSRRQQEYYMKQLDEAPQSGGMEPIPMDYGLLASKIHYYGHPLPKWLYSQVEGKRRSDLDGTLWSVFSKAACLGRGALTIYAGSYERDWEKAFLLMMQALRLKRELLGGLRVIVLLPDQQVYYRFRDYAQDYLEMECGIPNPVDEPIDLAGFSVVILRRFYNDILDQVGKIGEQPGPVPPGHLDMEVIEKGLDPWLVSRMFGKVYELDMGVVVRMTSSLIGFSDALMGVMSLFVPTITLQTQQSDRFFIDTLTKAQVQRLDGAGGDGTIGNVCLKTENVKRLEGAGETVPLYVEGTPTQLISYFFKQNALQEGFKLEEFRIDAVIDDQAATESIWQELLTKAHDMTAVADRREKYRSLAREVIRNDLLAYDSSEERKVISYYTATAKSCLECLFKRQALYPNRSV